MRSIKSHLSTWGPPLLAAALLLLARTATAFADDCSGPSDCATTTWFDNALQNGFLGLAAGALGLTPLINLLFPNLTLGPKPNAPGVQLPPSIPVNADVLNSKLNQLSNSARRHNNPALDALVNKYRPQLLGPDGKVRPDVWDKFKNEARNAIGQWSQSGEKPNSWVWDAGASVLGAGKEFGVQVGTTIWDAAVWVGTKELQIADAILHPGETLDSMKETGRAVVVNTMQWMDRTIPKEWSQEFRDAVKDGRYLDAAGTFAKIEGTILWEGGKTIGHELLPIDEIGSFFDPHADMETRLWAIPAAAAKIAGILTSFERLATMPVPGLGQTTTLIPSVRAPAMQAARLAELAGRAGELGNAARATQRVESALSQALSKEGPITNIRQLQNIISKNPELRGILDDAIKAGGDGKSLYTLADAGVMSKDAHALLTARKLQVQEQAMANATRRLITEEVSSLPKGQAPGSYQTFNATQGSRTQLTGANVRADLDQTVLGIKNVSPQRAREILAEECRKLGMDPKNLDTNLYLPKRGLADVTGDKPFSEDALKRILQQNTSESGRYHVFVDKQGQVHVTGPFKGRGSDVLSIGEQQVGVGGRVAPGTPGRMLTPQQAQDLGQQLQSMGKYAQGGEWDKLIKSANRASDLGAFDGETRQLIRTLAGEKRPAELAELLHRNGFSDWEQFNRHLQSKLR